MYVCNQCVTRSLGPKSCSFLGAVIKEQTGVLSISRKFEHDVVGHCGIKGQDSHAKQFCDVI